MILPDLKLVLDYLETKAETAWEEAVGLVYRWSIHAFDPNAVVVPVAVIAVPDALLSGKEMAVRDEGFEPSFHVYYGMDATPGADMGDLIWDKLAAFMATLTDERWGDTDAGDLVEEWHFRGFHFRNDLQMLLAKQGIVVGMVQIDALLIIRPYESPG